MECGFNSNDACQFTEAAGSNLVAWTFETKDTDETGKSLQWYEERLPTSAAKPF